MDGWMDVVDVYRSMAEDEDVGVMCVISTIYLRACVARGGAGIHGRRMWMYVKRNEPRSTVFCLAFGASCRSYKYI
jgi:hypothetical protein